MICPRCSCPGALIVGSKVLCVNKRCRWYDADSHAKWRKAITENEAEFSGDGAGEVLRHLWELDRRDREARDRAERERVDD